MPGCSESSSRVGGLRGTEKGKCRSRPTSVRVGVRIYLCRPAIEHVFSDTSYAPRVCVCRPSGLLSVGVTQRRRHEREPTRILGLSMLSQQPMWGSGGDRREGHRGSGAGGAPVRTRCEPSHVTVGPDSDGDGDGHAAQCRPNTASMPRPLPSLPDDVSLLILNMLPFDERIRSMQRYVHVQRMQTLADTQSLSETMQLKQSWLMHPLSLGPCSVQHQLRVPLASTACSFAGVAAGSLRGSLDCSQIRRRVVTALR